MEWVVRVKRLRQRERVRWVQNVLKRYAFNIDFKEDEEEENNELEYCVGRLKIVQRQNKRFVI